MQNAGDANSGNDTIFYLDAGHISAVATAKGGNGGHGGRVRTALDGHGFPLGTRSFGGVGGTGSGNSSIVAYNKITNSNIRIGNSGHQGFRNDVSDDNSSYSYSNNAPYNGGDEGSDIHSITGALWVNGSRGGQGGFALSSTGSGQQAILVNNQFQPCIPPASVACGGVTGFTGRVVIRRLPYNYNEDKTTGGIGRWSGWGTGTVISE
jgi:hypothetical protein